MVSVIRIILSALLIPLLHTPSSFIIVYIAIGVSDVLDGFIARKFGLESDFGARLDSFADFLFYSVLTFIVWKLYMPMLADSYRVAVIFAVFIRVLNVILTKWKYKKVVFVHTLASELPRT